MTFLGIDVGSSSVKAGVFHDGGLVGGLARAAYPTRHEGVRVEVDAEDVLTAAAAAVRLLGGAAGGVDAVGLSVMSPAWVAMDASGRAVTPLVTHQDRRSVETAKALEQRVGKERHLQLAGNRPFPGGISSTTCAWFLANEPAAMASADLVGHLNTFLHRQLTGARVIDPSNASFTGLYLTTQQGGWSDELCGAAGVSKSLLPDVVEADVVAGRVTPEAALRFGLTAGTPVTVGMVDTSAAMLSTGAAPGQLFHMCGSTDVLGLAADRPAPHERLLTRALGVGRRWMSVSTLAAAGSSIDWARGQFFRDLTDADFHRLLADLVHAARPAGGAVRPVPGRGADEHRAEAGRVFRPDAGDDAGGDAARGGRVARRRQRRPAAAAGLRRRPDAPRRRRQRRRRRAWARSCTATGPAGGRSATSSKPASKASPPSRRASGKASPQIFFLRAFVPSRRRN